MRAPATLILVASVLFVQCAAPAGLPPAEDQAKVALEESPQHGEYIDVKLPEGGATIPVGLRTGSTARPT